jgi:F-type H+-transporting ATPase subunit delta
VAYAAGASVSSLARVADQLLDVADLLGREPRLRRALADPARSAVDRAELIRQVLIGKVDAEALGLIETLVAARWPTAGALRDAAELLGAHAVLASAEQAGELTEVEDELFRFAQVVDGSAQLAAVLGNPGAPVAQRATLTGQLLGGKARPATVRLVRLALAGFGGRAFAASLARLIELAAAARDHRVAYVISATALDDDDELRLGEELSRRYGRKISLHVSVDPQLVGGLSVQIGSDLYDGSILRRLTEARAALTS